MEVNQLSWGGEGRGVRKVVGFSLDIIVNYPNLLHPPSYPLLLEDRLVPAEYLLLDW